MTQLLPARILRPEAERCLSRPPTTPKDRRTLEYLLESATNMLEKHGRAALEIPHFAVATGIGARTIRRLACDIHHLFGLILTRYVDSLIATIGAIPTTHPDHHARARAEYRRLTTDETNAPTKLQILWLRDRFTLPAEELAPLEAQRRILGRLLAGDAGETALSLLDSPCMAAPMPLAQIAAMLQAGADHALGRAGIPAPHPELPLAAGPAATPLPIRRAPPLPTLHRILPPAPTFRAMHFPRFQLMPEETPQPPPILKLRQSLFRTATSLH